MAARKPTKGRAPNGAGTIYQRESGGRWVGAAHVLTVDGTHRRKVVYGRTWEEVHGRLIELEERDRRGVPAPN